MKTQVILLTFVVLLMTAITAWGEIVTKTIEYKQGDTVLEGYLAYDDAIKGKRPGVLVVHEWYGLNDYAKRRAREVAGLGYVAFAADIYGKGVRANTAEEAAKLSGEFLKDPELLRARVNAALSTLAANEMVDSSKLGAIGYCFGGTTVLELARSGADLKGVVSFHGGLAQLEPNKADNIKASVLAMQGADDKWTIKDAPAFQEEMRKAGVDWEMTYYSGAVHSFTNPASGNDPSKGIAYNKKADERSWVAMEDFFKEIFK